MPQQKIGMYGQFRPTGVDTSGAQRLKALAGLSDQVGDIAFQMGVKQRTKEGVIEGTRAGIEAAKSGEEFKPEEPGLFSVYDAAYDQSVRAAYVSSVDTTNKAKFTELAANNSLDVDNFNLMSNKYMNGVLGGVDEETKLMLQPSMEKTISDYGVKIRFDQQKDNLEKADNIQQVGITDNVNESLNFAFEGKFQDAADSLEKSQALLTVRLNTGKISLVEYDKQSKAMTNSVDTEVNRFQFGELLKGNNVDQAVSFIQKVHDQKIKGKTTEWHRELLSTLQSDMSNHFSLIDKKESDKKDKRTINQKDNNSQMMVKLIDGTLTTSNIRLGIESGSISDSQGKSLMSSLNKTGGGVDDHGLIIEINEMIRVDPEKAQTLIMGNFKSRLTGETATKLHKLALDVEQKELEGGQSELKTADAKRFRKFVTDTVKVQDKYGGFDTEKQKLAAKLMVVYDERILGGEKPSEVARDMINVDVAYDIGEPMFGSVTDLQASETQLTEAYRAQKGDKKKWNIQPEDYDAEMERIDKLRENEKLLNNFSAAYEAALNGE